MDFQRFLEIAREAGIEGSDDDLLGLWNSRPSYMPAESLPEDAVCSTFIKMRKRLNTAYKASGDVS